MWYRHIPIKLINIPNEKKTQFFLQITSLRERVAFLMNTIQLNELNIFAQELDECLLPALLQDITKLVGFVQ